MQQRSNLNAQFVQCLFVFRRDRITVQLFEESRVIPDFQVIELPRTSTSPFISADSRSTGGIRMRPCPSSSTTCPK